MNRLNRFLAAVMPLTRCLTNESAGVSMSRYRGLLAVLLLSMLPLSGCFKSAMPLITMIDSVAPIPNGRYAYVDDNKATKYVTIAHDGTATKRTMTDADGSVNVDWFLMQKLDRSYYVVMDAKNNYALISVNSNSFTLFKASALCEKLLGVARSAGKSISEYGVIQVDGDTSQTCWFDDIYNVKVAFVALLNSGTRLSNGDFLVDGIEIGPVFKRQ